MSSPKNFNTFARLSLRDTIAIFEVPSLNCHVVGSQAQGFIIQSNITKAEGINNKRESCTRDINQNHFSTSVTRLHYVPRFVLPQLLSTNVMLFRWSTTDTKHLQHLEEENSILKSRLEIEDWIRSRMVQSGPDFCHSCQSPTPQSHLSQTACSHFLCQACIDAHRAIDEEHGCPPNEKLAKCPICWAQAETNT